MTVAGQVVLVHQTGFISAAISAFQSRDKTVLDGDQRWNHTAMMINETECIGAEPGGARRRKLSYFTDYELSHIPYRTRQQMRNAVSFMRRHINAPYAYADIALIAIALETGEKTPNWIEKKISSSNEFICSEMVDKALQVAGIQLLDDHRPPSTVYPAAIATALRDKGWR